jgi:hypothetical protein
MTIPRDVRIEGDAPGPEPPDEVEVDGPRLVRIAGPHAPQLRLDGSQHVAAQGRCRGLRFDFQRRIVEGGRRRGADRRRVVDARQPNDPDVVGQAPNRGREVLLPLDVRAEGEERPRQVSPPRVRAGG